jgi:hypothetical protein
MRLRGDIKTDDVVAFWKVKPLTTVSKANKVTWVPAPCKIQARRVEQPIERRLFLIDNVEDVGLVIVNGQKVKVLPAAAPSIVDFKALQEVTVLHCASSGAACDRSSTLISASERLEQVIKGRFIMVQYA